MYLGAKRRYINTLPFLPFLYILRVKIALLVSAVRRSRSHAQRLWVMQTVSKAVR